MPKKAIDDARANAEVKKQQEQQQKETERKLQQVELSRMYHAMRLTDLGFDEMLVLRYEQNNIHPDIQIFPISPEVQAKNREMLQKAIDEFTAMIEGKVPGAGLVGADGAPISQEAA